MENNTVAPFPTRFLMGVELIRQTRGYYSIASENWVYPIRSFGYHKDPYYAEIWSGCEMDWEKNFWILEQHGTKSPLTYPLLLFRKREEREKFNEYDFDNLLEGLMYLRRFSIQRDKSTIVLSKDIGYHWDGVFVFLHIIEPIVDKKMHRCCFVHASQERVEFWLNTGLLPLHEMDR